jgi:hypothetical protein
MKCFATFKQKRRSTERVLIGRQELRLILGVDMMPVSREAKATDRYRAALAGEKLSRLSGLLRVAGAA